MLTSLTFLTSYKLIEVVDLAFVTNVGGQDFLNDPRA